MAAEPGLGPTSPCFPSLRPHGPAAWTAGQPKPISCSQKHPPALWLSSPGWRPLSRPEPRPCGTPWKAKAKAGWPLLAAVSPAPHPQGLMGPENTQDKHSLFTSGKLSTKKFSVQVNGLWIRPSEYGEIKGRFVRVWHRWKPASFGCPAPSPLASRNAAPAPLASRHLDRTRPALCGGGPAGGFSGLRMVRPMWTLARP